MQGCINGFVIVLVVVVEVVVVVVVGVVEVVAGVVVKVIGIPMSCRACTTEREMSTNTSIN